MAGRENALPSQKVEFIFKFGENMEKNRENTTNFDKNLKNSINILELNIFILYLDILLIPMGEDLILYMMDVFQK